jgi:hypothetical protein
MGKTAITSAELAPPVGPFSQAIEVGGFVLAMNGISAKYVSQAFPPAPRSRPQRYRSGVALRSTSSSRHEATPGS